MSKRIHITSSGPRTGTTLLTELFKSCFNIDCSCDHEAPISKSNSSFGKCNTVLTKKPSSTDKLWTILDKIKGVYVVCVIRDPRDMIVSYHGRITDEYYCGLNFWFKFLSDYEKLKDHPRFILIRYEDFTTNPDEIQKQIEQKIPFLKQKHKFSEYHLYAKPDDDTLKALKKLRPIESKGIGTWKKHLPRIKQQLIKYGDITDSLRQFEYEENPDWKKTLENISLQEFDSYKNESIERKNSNKSVLVTLFNFWCEKIHLNPDRILKSIRSITHSTKIENVEKQ
ncbi:sulfotransferase domain-containing protein [Aequorivita sp. F47161]|uniref:Sulfotransferase domain-containing protein n=1 Tax=Aequorivita vitellina TaxID=2874475 RepID=A0A9X1U2E1_9FLAO|nr:sulfotransferase domain-containing protein [Aequorivita vitellina]MCG2419780.1 sulfotransferase domain-containing protein [Aequorivita vitellina]